MTQQQTERDDALIAEVARAISRKVDSFGDTERTEQQRAELEWPRYREHAKAAIDLILARENWTPPAKPDRYLQVWKEAKDAYIYPNRTEHESDQVAAAVLRNHFEPPSEVVAAAKKVRGAVPGSYGVVPGSNIAIMRDFILKGDV